MKPKTIEDVLERVKTWPEVAQADLERGVYGETYVPTPEEVAVLKQRIKDLDDGTVEPVSYEEVRALFAKYRL